MKPKFLFIFLFFIYCTVNIFSQGWAPTGARWYYTHIPSFFSPDQGYYKVESIGDTIVFTRTCKKLLKTRVDPNGNSFNEGIEIMYSSGDTVFRLSDDNQFYVLYNFAASPGDTWNIRSYDIYLTHDTTSIIRVDSVKSIVINNETLRTLYTTTINGYLEYGNPKPIIEKLGDTGHWMLPGNWGLWDGDIKWGLRCYEDSSFGFYQSNISPTCDYLIPPMQVNEITLQSQISISPNPTSGIFVIEAASNKQRVSSIEIHNMLREKVFQSTNLLINKSTIDISSQPSGVYFLRVSFPSGEVKADKETYTQKLIIQK